MRAYIRVEASKGWAGSSEGDEVTAQDSRAFTVFVLDRIREALPDYAEMIVVAGVEDSPEEARQLLINECS